MRGFTPGSKKRPENGQKCGKRWVFAKVSTSIGFPHMMPVYKIREREGYLHCTEGENFGF